MGKKKKKRKNEMLVKLTKTEYSISGSMICEPLVELTSFFEIEGIRGRADLSFLSSESNELLDRLLRCPDFSVKLSWRIIEDE